MNTFTGMEPGEARPLIAPANEGTEGDALHLKSKASGETEWKTVTPGLTVEEGNELWAEKDHTHAIEDVEYLHQSLEVMTTAINGKALSTHDHSIENVTGLQTVLNGKASKVDIQEFSSSGTWTKPSSGTFAIIEIVGGGTGGGSGSKYAAGVNHSGGSGGAGGSYCYRIMPLSALAATEPVTIGAGGLGGAAITTDDTPGIAGGMGQSSFFGTHLCGPGASTAAGGGLLNANAAVSNALINWAPAGTQGMFSGGSGGQGFSANFGGTPPSTCYGAAGGGGGSGVGTTAQNRSGGHGGSSSVFNSLAFNAQNNTFGYRGQTTPSIHGWDSTILPGGMAGGGGGGGCVLELIATPVAGNGGNGVNGGGGGGGGAGVNGSFNSGAGGNGGNGFCRVIVF